MKTILISVKEGATIFGGGSIFLIEDRTITTVSDGAAGDYYQLPDDGMGRPCLVRTTHVQYCSENDLLHAEKGHGRCIFTKEEILHLGSKKFTDDFSVRTISFQQQNLMWRLPRNDRSEKKATFHNKVTLEKTEILAFQVELEYEVFSLDSSTYEQTVRKFNGLFSRWDLGLLSPGFYAAHVNIGYECVGVVHFIKFYPVQLLPHNPEKTDAVSEVEFSESLWNKALELKLAWGPASRRPFADRLMEEYTGVTWSQCNYLEKICDTVSSFAWLCYEKEAARSITLAEADKQVADAFPWVDEEQRSRLKSLGQYYLKMRG